MKKAISIDPSRCDGCRNCEIACAIAKEGEPNLSKARIRVVRFPDAGYYYPFICLQCESPYCVARCPASALTKNPDTGVVEHDKGKCVGCKMCLLACPFGAIKILEGFPSRCDFCGGDPVCVKFCEPGAIALTNSPGEIITRHGTMGDKIKNTYLNKPGT